METEKQEQPDEAAGWVVPRLTSVQGLTSFQV